MPNLAEIGVSGPWILWVHTKIPRPPNLNERGNSTDRSGFVSIVVASRVSPRRSVHHPGRHHDGHQFPSTPLSEGFSHPRAPAWIARMPMVNWEAAGPTVRFAGVSLPWYIGSILHSSKRRHCSPRAINLYIAHDPSRLSCTVGCRYRRLSFRT
mgnify:CR=1 FL=1